MKRAILLLVSAICATALGAERFFSAGSLGDDSDFVERWYTEQLVALEEPSLCCAARPEHRVIRFTWLRSFHHPVVIRLDQSGNGAWTLTTKMTDGAGGYKPGRLTIDSTRKLRDGEAARVLSLVSSNGDFWRQRSVEVDAPEPDGSIVVHADGAQWIVEVRDGDKYHVVDRWSPESGLIHDIGMGCIALANRDFGDVY